jgi:hypothetical protein
MENSIFIEIYKFITTLLMPISVLMLIVLSYKRRKIRNSYPDGYQKVVSSQGVFFIKAIGEMKIITKKGNIAEIPNRGLSVEAFNEQLVETYLND